MLGTFENLPHQSHLLFEAFSHYFSNKNDALSGLKKVLFALKLFVPFYSFIQNLFSPKLLYLWPCVTLWRDTVMSIKEETGQMSKQNKKENCSNRIANCA